MRGKIKACLGFAYFQMSIIHASQIQDWTPKSDLKREIGLGYPCRFVSISVKEGQNDVITQGPAKLERKENQRLNLGALEHRELGEMRKVQTRRTKSMMCEL